MKQLTGNASLTSLEAGWRLLALCLSVFPPSDELARHLEYFLHQVGHF